VKSILLISLSQGDVQIMASTKFKPSKKTAYNLFIVAALATTALTTNPAQAQSTKPAIPIEEIGADQAELSKVFNIAPKSVLKGVTKIAIPFFAVETAIKTGAGIKQETGTGSVAQSVTYLLAGVPQKEMQQAVDSLYDGLVSELKVLGIEVVPPEQIIATNAYKQAALTVTSPNKQEGNNAEALVYSAKGMALGLSNSRFIFNRTAGVASGAGSIGALFNAAKTVGQLSSQVSDASLATAIGEELNVPVLILQVPLEFVEQVTKSQGGFFGGGSAEVHSRLRLTVGFNSFLSVGTNKEFSSHVTITPLILSGAPVQAVKDTSSVAANVGLGLLSAALGSRSSSRMTEKTAEADPTKFVESVVQGLGKFNKIVATAVKAMQ
jgi:hypothetical protein